MLEHAHRFEHGHRDLALGQILAVLGIADEPFEVLHVVHDLERDPERLEQFAERTHGNVATARDDRADASEDRSRSSGLEHVDVLHLPRQQRDLSARHDLVGHARREALNVQCLAEMSEAHELEVALVDLQLGRAIQPEPREPRLPREVAERAGVDRERHAVSDMTRGTTAASGRAVLDIVDDQRTDVDHLGQRQ